jgi:hypothetical protein
LYIYFDSAKNLLDVVVLPLKGHVPQLLIGFVLQRRRNMHPLTDNVAEFGDQVRALLVLNGSQ